MAPRRIDPADLASALPAGGRTLVVASSGESLLLADALMRAREALGAMTFTGIFVPGLNKRDYLATVRTKAFFFGLVVAPLLFGGGSIAMSLFKSKPDLKDKHVAIVDHTGVVADALDAMTLA